MKNLVKITLVLLLFAAFSVDSHAYTVSYKQIVTSDRGNMPEMTMLVWMKDGAMRMEMEARGQKMIMINREDGTYNYMPAQNMVMKIPRVNNENKDFIKNPEKYLKYLEKMGAKKVGQEVIDGKKCDIYEYLEPGSDSHIKAWVWTEKNFPVKMLMDSDRNKTEIRFTDIKINEPISEKLFQVPPGARVMDMTNMRSPQDWKQPQR